MPRLFTPTLGLILIIGVGTGSVTVFGQEVEQTQKVSCLNELPSRPPSISESGVTPIRYKRLVEIRTPGGSLCPAEVKLMCNQEIKEETRLPTGQGKMTWHHPCSTPFLVVRCTQGAFSDFIGMGGAPEGDSLNSDNWVIYAGNSPEEGDGMLMLKTRVAATIEIEKAGTNKMVGRLRTFSGYTGISLDAGDYEISATSILDSREGKSRVKLEKGRTIRHTIEFTPPSDKDSVPIYDPDLDAKKYPQLSVQICDEQRNPVDRPGELIIHRVDKHKISIRPVQKGRFELYGLEKGAYDLEFHSRGFQAKKSITIPLQLFIRGQTASSPEPSPKSESSEGEN